MDCTTIFKFCQNKDCSYYRIFLRLETPAIYYVYCILPMQDCDIKKRKILDNKFSITRFEQREMHAILPFSQSLQSENCLRNMNREICSLSRRSCNIMRSTKLHGSMYNVLWHEWRHIYVIRPITTVPERWCFTIRMVTKVKNSGWTHKHTTCPVIISWHFHSRITKSRAKLLIDT